MGAMASQITSVSIVCPTVCSGADQRIYQSPASLAFVRGSHRRPVNSPHKGPVTRKMFPFHEVIMAIRRSARCEVGQCSNYCITTIEIRAWESNYIHILCGCDYFPMPPSQWGFRLSCWIRERLDFKGPYRYIYIYSNKNPATRKTDAMIMVMILSICCKHHVFLPLACMLLYYMKKYLSFTGILYLNIWLMVVQLSNQTNITNFLSRNRQCV